MFRFTLIKEHLVEFNQLAMANAEGSDDMLNRVMTKDNIGLAAMLETKEGAFEAGELSFFLSFFLQFFVSQQKITCFNQTFETNFFTFNFNFFFLLFLVVQVFYHRIQLKLINHY